MSAHDRRTEYRALYRSSPKTKNALQKIVSNISDLEVVLTVLHMKRSQLIATRGSNRRKEINVQQPIKQQITQVKNHEAYMRNFS